ncbi:hypothetical protein [Neorhizobium alkalisoli]|jgi:hypothetical protein|uniref:Uncharacterized protein n=1 Tax=Neorhizobium alkalisoli TaxID=528178 RepID=A0A561R2Y1_9HYPH|nr:hypothetical protein [Neorhizobium alkalisoli]TWF56975.1 hypothetical protein FHW37_102615 [Neorhizobium alkalisoli]
MTVILTPIRALRESFYQINAAVSASRSYSCESSSAACKRDPASAAIFF